MAKSKYHAAVIMLMVIICAFLIMFVWVSARAAELQYDINMLNKQIQQTSRRVQNLQVKIKSSSNINNLEHRAEELGMVYPCFDQIVYLEPAKGRRGDLAQALKTAAYR